MMSCDVDFYHFLYDNSIHTVDTQIAKIANYDL